MEKEFTYVRKETYTQEDLDGILKGYKGYMNNSIEGTHVALDDYNKLKDELTPYKTKEAKKALSNELKEVVADGMLDDAIALSGIKEGMTKDEKVAAIKATVETREYLKFKKEDNTPGSVTKTLTVEEIKNKKEKENEVKSEIIEKAFSENK